jgi:superfamily II DNA or RNA helicase
MAQAYAQIQQALERHRSDTEDQVPAWQPVNWNQVNLPELRQEQRDAVQAWSESKNGLVIMPTGTGKTEVALRVMADQTCSTLIVAPIRDLMYQWHRRIVAGLNYDAGIIGDNTYNVKPISVTTYDSACIHMPRLGNRFQLIVFDECHHLPGAVRGDAARMSAAPMRLGLTATLSPDDRRCGELFKLVGPVVYRLGINDVTGSSLAEYDVYRITVKLTQPEQVRYDTLAAQVASYVYERRQEEDTFNWSQLCKESPDDMEARETLRAFREKQSIEDQADAKFDVIEDLLRLHHGTPMIIFAGSNAMAREISLRYLIPCLLSHCGKAERLDYLDGLRDGVFCAIVANQILDEGVDIPAVKIAIVVGGMASERQATQRLGRILRRSGTERAILYEVVCADTNEVKRSRKRRKNDAYARTRHRKN